jgi:hypothetical protein
MRRLLTFVVLSLFALPFGISVAGCSKATPVTYCSGGDSGPVVGQVATIDLEPRLTGISLNEGQIGSIGTPSAKDCRSNTASATSYTYGTTNSSLVDIEPTNGQICAGTWNRNTGGGIADFTVCTPSAVSGVAYITASAGGATSNALPVFVHPVVTSIVLGPASTNCTTDPASNCIDLTKLSGCDSGSVPSTSVPSYTGTACISQGGAAQLTARTYAGTGASQTNISCLVGPLSFSASNPISSSASASSVVTIDTNGVATAQQPGAALISATLSQSSSTAGSFATCPPKSIVLTAAGQTAAPTAPLTVNQNVQQDLVATVIDTKGNPINNISLTYQSTVPQTVPVAGSIITPVFPGSATVTASCQPPTCNASPFDQIGLFGNGLTVLSNNVLVNAAGTGNSTVLYIGSTGSQYIQPYDFTVTTQSAPVRLPYAPNSMVLSEDLSTIYMGSTNELMIFSTLSNALTNQITALSGTVLAASNDNSTVVVTDPVRQLIYLYGTLSSGSIISEYGGVGTHAEFSPDSQTVYITTTDGRLLVYSTFSGWNSQALTTQPTDVAVTVPTAGVYLGGTPVTGHTNCPVTTTSGPAGNQTTSNAFYPLADTTTANADRIAATNDGVHILGASAAAKTFSDIQVASKTGACPVSFASTTNPAIPLSTAVPSTITGVLPTSDSSYAFLTYAGTGGVVPQYTVATKSLVNLPLQKNASGTPVAPVAGVISSDNQTLYVGSSGDNVVHVLTRGPSGFADTAAPLMPALPGLTSGIATPNLLVQKPRKSTN